MRYPLMLKRFLGILLLTAGFLPVFSQDTLPRFTVKNRFGKVIISWTNAFSDVVLINIQRSPDSLKGYKTILAVADPKAITNGYLDNKAPNTTQYYRLYVQQGGGKYFFTAISQPVVDSSRSTPGNNSSNYQLAKNNNGSFKFANGKFGEDSTVAKVPPLRDVFIPSIFVHTNAQGHVMIVLPDNKTNSYTIKFFKDDGTPLFTMNKVKESQLIIDKTNFQKAGWFRFELYENGVLKEKHKFLIPKDN
jgi:hypothetical protein